MIKDDIKKLECIVNDLRSAVEAAERRKQELSSVLNEPKGRTLAEINARNKRLEACIDAVNKCTEARKAYVYALDALNSLSAKYCEQLRKRASELEDELGLK